MKRVVSIVLILAMAVMLFAGCGGKAAADSSSPTGSINGDLAGKWLMVRYAAGDNVFEYDRLGEAGMNENTYFDLSADGSGTYSLMGNTMEVQFHDGKVSVQGADLYTYSFAEPDVLEVDMAGSIYTMARDGSTALTAYQGVTTESSDNLYADAGKTKGNSDEYEPRDNEIEYKLDGGRCFYKLIDSTEGMTAYITWMYVDNDDLYIPAEIDGAKVVKFGFVNGHAKNLYIPGTIKQVGYHACNETWYIEGLKNIYFGYGDYPMDHTINVRVFDIGDEVEKIEFSDYLTEDEEDWMSQNMIGPADCPNLKEVVNMPETWKLSYEGHKALIDFMSKKDPNAYIHPQSDEITQLAMEVTEGCTTDEEKLYKISEWIVDNISYDYYELMGGREGDRKDDYGNYFEREQEPEDLLKNRIGVCAGYANLTKAMCNAVGIPAAYISGVTKACRHAYSIVYINGKWRIYDNTENDSNYNADLSLRTDLFQFGNQITYEAYMANEELQEAYSWEEIEVMNQENAEPFADGHDYWDVDPMHLPSVIPEYVDDEKIPYEHPYLNDFIDSSGYGGSDYENSLYSDEE